MITIVGTLGEGGGQILRSALALSMCTQKPFRITQIRGKRKKPGLMRQHLTAVLAAKTICGGTTAGAEIGSSELEFTPGPVIPGDYRFAVGTAGSATLVLQTILPPLMVADRPSQLVLEGGTHNAWAPPFHFVQNAFFPALRRMGVECTAELEHWGFFPAGGGKFRVTVTPGLHPMLAIDLTERGSLVQAEVLAAVCKVPFEVAEDECRLIAGAARYPVTRTRPETVWSIGPGNIAMIDLQFEHSAAVFSCCGEIGVSRKTVALRVGTEANRLFRSAAAVDQHLADQLLIPLALTGGGKFSTLEPTAHTLTNKEIITKFLPVDIAIQESRKGLWLITVSRQEDK